MTDPETFGLNVTNSVLGTLVVASLLVVFSALLHDIARRVKSRGWRRRNRVEAKKAAPLRMF
jgi:hypothetical protein